MKLFELPGVCRRQLMDDAEATPDVAEDLVVAEASDTRPRFYAAPRRFDLATILVVTAAYSILLGCLSGFGAHPILSTTVAGFITFVGLGQALLFGGRRPRLASSLVGGCMFGLPITAGLMLLPQPRPAPPINFASVFIGYALCGAILGYLAGVLIGGVFLVADVVRRRELRTLAYIVVVAALVIGIVAILIVKVVRS
jgi:hypothetical protein